MATEPSEQYGNSEWQKEIGWPFQDISWPVPTVINVVPDLEAEYANVANDFLAFTEKAGEQIRLQQQQIDYLEAEIRGLEHTNAVRLGIIDQQAATIKNLQVTLAAETAVPYNQAIKHSAADNLG